MFAFIEALIKFLASEGTFSIKTLYIPSRVDDLC